MPIEFPCSQCEKTMQAPDGTEGKKARCPACSAITQIPDTAVASTVPIAKESSLAASPLEVSDNPFAAPSTTDFSSSPEAVARRRSGTPAWDAQPSFGSFFKTSVDVLTNPNETFRNLIPDAGLGRPVIYGAIVGAITGLMLSGLVVSMFAFLAVNGVHNQNPVAPSAGEIAVAAVVVILVLPIVYGVMFPLGALMGAGMIHAMLMLFGARKYNFSATARAVCYLYFAAWPFALVIFIPFVGVIAAIPLGVWMIAVYIIGLTEVHETTVGRVSLAIFAPVVLLIGLGVLLAIVG